jgi:hypothetical protein
MNILVKGGVNMNATEFVSRIKEVFGPELNSRGYKEILSATMYDEEGDVLFEKKLQDGIFIVINVQPSPRNLNDFNRFAINLVRNAPGYRRYLNWQTIPGYFLNERLASALWITDRTDPEWESDHWWSFANEEQFEKACSDALAQLIEYGISYLEDLNTKSLRLIG